jgi:hypothetical protein
LILANGSRCNLPPDTSNESIPKLSHGNFFLGGTVATDQAGRAVFRRASQ